MDSTTISELEVDDWIDRVGIQVPGPFCPVSGVVLRTVTQLPDALVTSANHGTRRVGQNC